MKPFLVPEGLPGAAALPPQSKGLFPMVMEFRKVPQKGGVMAMPMAGQPMPMSGHKYICMYAVKVIDRPVEEKEFDTQGWKAKDGNALFAQKGFLNTNRPVTLQGP